MLADGTTNTPAFLRVFELAPGTLAASNIVSTNPSQGLAPRDGMVLTGTPADLGKEKMRCVDAKERSESLRP